MNKTYELPKGRSIVAEFDENGVGKITVQALDSLICELNEYAERQTGEWINTGVDEEWYARAYECSLCGHTMVGTDNYCPNCGAKMVEPQESEDEE